MRSARQCARFAILMSRRLYTNQIYSSAAVLVLYLTRKLLYTDDEATVIYHAYSAAVYFFCVPGAIISDSLLGKFKTILYLSMVYILGNIALSAGSIPTLGLPARYAIVAIAHAMPLV